MIVGRPVSAALVSRSDEELLAAMAAGERDALGVLYDRFAPVMLGVATRILGSPQEGEDLVHDVLLEAWQRAPHYDPARGTVRTWLLLRLRSRALDRKRRSGRRPTTSLDASTLSAPVSETEASLPERRALRRVLDELSEEHRAVLELGYFEQCTCAEIASRLSIPVGTVKSRMSRGIAQIRARIGEPNGERP